MEFINTLLSPYTAFITLYALASTLVMIIIATNTRKKKKRYMILKNEKINVFGLWNREYEASPDVFMQQLFDENERLEKLVKVLRSEKTNLSIAHAFTIFLFIIAMLFYTNKSTKKNETPTP